MTKSTREGSSRTCLVPQPDLSDGTPQVSLRLADSSSCLKEMDLTDEISFVNSGAFFFRLVLLFCLRIYFLICSVPAPPALSILNMFFFFFFHWSSQCQHAVVQGKITCLSVLKPHIPTGALQSLIHALVCHSNVTLRTYEDGLLGRGVQMDRTDLKSGTRNDTEHKMQPKCRCLLSVFKCVWSAQFKL